MSSYGSPQFYIPRWTPAVRAIIIGSVVLFLLQLILGSIAGLDITAYLGFTPARLLQLWLWQPFTYPFLHSGIFHILFNLLVVWTTGSDLEQLWGSIKFTTYFFLCALGAALVYGLYSLIGLGFSANLPLVGSSGAVFGLLTAYGLLFGDRTLYFFMLFPLQARYFVLILGAVELVSSIFYSQNGGIAHTAHLGGMLMGFGYLWVWARLRQGKRQAKDREGVERRHRIKNASHLKLVESEEDKPKHWH